MPSRCNPPHLDGVPLHSADAGDEALLLLSQHVLGSVPKLVEQGLHLPEDRHGDEIFTLCLVWNGEMLSHSHCACSLRLDTMSGPVKGKERLVPNGE